MTIELLRVLNWNNKTLSNVDINPEHFAELLSLLESKEITELSAKKLLNRFIPNSFPPNKEIKKISKISDRKDIEEICKKVMKENKPAVNDYKAGQAKALFFLIGKVMETTNRRADVNIVKEILMLLIKI